MRGAQYPGRGAAQAQPAEQPQPAAADGEERGLVARRGQVQQQRGGVGGRARYGAALAGLPVWLFSSGPLGAENPQPPGDPAGVAAVLAATGARGHRVFAGRLERGDLGLGERAISRLVHAPEGDFRDWPAIRAWAREIGAALVRPGAVTTAAAAPPREGQ